MGEGASNTPKPGFQGSETSSAEVWIHSQGGDPIILGASGAQTMAGRYRTDSDNTLLSVNTNKSLEQAGTWQVAIKPARGVTDNILERVVDDDWVDIVFKRHGRVWHTMRGIVGDIRRTRNVGGSGATSWLYTLSGYDFQKVFEITPIWFNRFSQKAENVCGELGVKIFTHLPNIGGDPETTVKGMLLGWFRELQGFGRATWAMPNTVPNTRGTFLADIEAAWSNLGYSGVPKRISIDPNLMNPQGNLWQLAKDWADPAFLEMFCDLSKQGTPLYTDEELDPDDSRMTVYFRDRPFVLSPGLTDDLGAPPDAALGVGLNSAWFSLPLHIVPRQQVVTDDVGRSGAERLNAFFVSPQTTAEMIRAAPPDMLPPLWDEADIQLHGFRRYDVASRYKADAGDLLTLTSLQRAMCRDWYAINPYLLNGTLNLACGRPDIRVGTRVRIPGDNGDTFADETYYVESVGHHWQFGPGLKTMVGVTRGWIGDDQSLVQAVTDLAGRYRVPAIATPDAVQDWAVT